MRTLFLALLLALASGVSAQPNARLHGAWTMSPDSPPPLQGGTEVVAMWMEFDADGRMLIQAHYRKNGADKRVSVAVGTYTDDGEQVTVNGRPTLLTVREDKGFRMSGIDGSSPVEFVRATVPVRGLDVVGEWEVVAGPAETLVLDSDMASNGAPEARFYLHDRLLDSGSWRVDPRGLTLETPGMGTVTYTALSRSGDTITLTGGGEPLVLQPLATR